MSKNLWTYLKTLIGPKGVLLWIVILSPLDIIKGQHGRLRTFIALITQFLLTIALIVHCPYIGLYISVSFPLCLNDIF